ncbi:SRPBCC family protein [Frankia sp. R43]|uniref:SRPBCC family protein n=1 Tax=Frankia sp. R43 TaxID=269536 RepID=UPI000ADA7D53|nr:SRPBCC family protein [Frankia sp. R43]
MIIETASTSVTHSVDVAAPAEHVFDVFTGQMNTWWDPTHHLLPGTVEMLVEPFVGGAITDVAADGSRCTWARVLAFDPPTHFAFSWNINLRWEIETDSERCSEVHVSFEATSETSTRVVLEHRHLDRHGEGWESMHDAVGGPDGWVRGLTRFAQTAARS